MAKDKPTDLLDWLGLSNAPNWRVSRPLGGVVGFLVVLLVLLALIATFSLLGRTILHGFSEAPVANLGTGAMIVAILSAPIVIWGTIIKQKTVDFQKEGHITDRISKAVEQLGAEKTVDRIGRPVTIWTGVPERVSYSSKTVESLEGKARTRVYPKEWRQWWNEETDDVEEGYRSTVETWPRERTVIQWQGGKIDLRKTEVVGLEGPWQAFSETLPNIEVRIGGLLSLERIAQDSTRYDKGRDHVRVMEILCAYIRENAPDSTAVDSDRKKWEDSQNTLPFPTWDQFKELHGRHKDEDLDAYLDIDALTPWAENLPPPRADLQLAMAIIGRRSPEQRRIEAHWGPETHAQAEWVFDTPCPELPERTDGKPLGQTVLDDFKTRLTAWKDSLTDYPGYRPDLRGCNLQRHDLSKLVLSGARLDGTRLEGADLRTARLEWTDLVEARLEGADLREARLEGADLGGARLEGADLSWARLEGADLSGAQLEGALLFEGRLEGANLIMARLERAVLHRAQLERANLGWAQLEGAGLHRARLEGAVLTEARLEGANLREARLEGVRTLRGAAFQGAALRGLSLASIPISPEQVKSTFGDASVTDLPDGMDRPAHWPDWELGDRFDKEWRKWQADPDTYTPPPKPEP